MSQRHALAEVLRAARRRGWTVVRTRRHLVLRHPNGAVVTASASPKDRHATRNITADLRRAEQTEPRGEP
jgi:predicted RNA binding protein YcfA (HicA-like mRNA interferase family)